MNKKVYTSRYTDACIYGGRAIGTIKFTNGRYTTDDPKKQQVIESSKWFKIKHILVEKEDGFAKVTKNESTKEDNDVVNANETNKINKDKLTEEVKVDEKVDPIPDLFACKVCGAEFGSANALNGHMISHRRKGEV